MRVDVFWVGLIFSSIASFTSARNPSHILENAIATLLRTSEFPKSSRCPTSTELIKMNNYGAAEHKVQTEDGYILTLHHIIPHHTKSEGPPVLLVHGFLSSSDLWLLADKNSSLAFILADAGFDVWLGNQRGSFYSREHKNYSNSDPNFWTFSFHELAVYDLPAFIDFILKENKIYSQLFYIGHSLGTTNFLIMSSLRPDYGEKVSAAFLLAPVAFPPATKELTPLLRLLTKDSSYLTYLSRMNSFEVLPRRGILVRAIQSFCTSPVIQPICLQVLGQTFGENRNNWIKDKIGFYLSCLPSGASLKVALHIIQLVHDGSLRQFNYGKVQNLKVYGTENHPEYNVSQAKPKILMYLGRNEKVLNPSTVDKLAKLLPNLVKSEVIEDPNFSHFDFVFGLNARDLVYDDIIKWMKAFSDKYYD